jgi:hypothetical protein
MIIQFVYRSRNTSPDFLIFYETSERFLSGANLYFAEDDGIGFAPTFLYLLFSPFTLLEPQVASKIFIAINSFLILGIIYLLRHHLPRGHLIIVLTVLNASYSIRSIVNNGQTGIIVLILQVWLLISVNKKSKKSLMLKSAVLFMLLELKPYLILPYFIYLLVSKKKESYMSIGFALIFEMIYFYINPTSTMYNYLRLIINRSQETKTEIDQSSFLSLVNGNLILFLFYLVAILIFVFKNFPKSEPDRVVILFILAPLISTYFHRQDSAFATLIFAMVLTKANKYFVAILILLLLNTGTFNIYFYGELLLMLTVLILLVPLTKNLGYFLVLGLTSYSYIIYKIGVGYGYQSAYGLWTFLVYLFQFMMFFYYVRHIKSGDLFSKNEID